jgi:hypothetical protein
VQLTSQLSSNKQEVARGIASTSGNPVYTPPMTVEEIEKRIKQALDKESSRSYWMGIVVGVLIGAAVGHALGYSQGSPQTVVVPLYQGIRT